MRHFMSQINKFKVHAGICQGISQFKFYSVPQKEFQNLDRGKGEWTRLSIFSFERLNSESQQNERRARAVPSTPGG